MSFADQGYSDVSINNDRAALDVRIKQYAAENKVSYAEAAAIVR